MKAIVFFLAGFFFYFHASAQTKPIEAILKLPEVKRTYYEMEISGSKVMYLPMAYGKSTFSINQVLAIKELNNADIAGIDLVYSDYPAKADFSALNRKRLEALYSLLPEVFLPEKIAFKK